MEAILELIIEGVATDWEVVSMSSKKQRNGDFYDKYVED